MFTSSFHFSVWLQLVPTSQGTFKVKGGHDIDAGWVKDVRANNTNVKIAPRLIFEQWSMGHLTQVNLLKNVMVVPVIV